MPGYRVTVAIEESVDDPRQAAEEARDDLEGLGPRIDLFTVTDLHTGSATVVQLDAPSTGREHPFAQRALWERP